MALISPRAAHNYAKNGYFPTDEKTVDAIISKFKQHDYSIRIFDPCIGEAKAINKIANSISHNRELYGIEYSHERAIVAKPYCDKFLRSDLFDTAIAQQSFGLVFLNPPYGNLMKETSDLTMNVQNECRRLEKQFYQFIVPTLQYNGILVLIIPYTQLDKQFSNWITNQFTDISVYSACDQQFKQIVIFGKKVRQNDITSTEKNTVRAKFEAIFEGKLIPERIDVTDTTLYEIPRIISDVKFFYKLSFTDEELLQEINSIKCLWSNFDLFLKDKEQGKRQPLCKMSDWHLSLALAAGEINGIVQSESGKVFIIKGNTYKSRTKIINKVFDDDTGDYNFETIYTDKFIPSIKAWDMTEGSNSFGELFTISTFSDEEKSVVVDLGQIVMSQGVKDLVENNKIDLDKFLDRHARADWGEISDEDANINNLVLQDAPKKGRLFSSYVYDENDDNNEVWILTEWYDGSHGFTTHARLPSEY